MLEGKNNRKVENIIFICSGIHRAEYGMSEHGTHENDAHVVQ